MNCEHRLDLALFHLQRVQEVFGCVWPTVDLSWLGLPIALNHHVFVAASCVTDCSCLMGSSFGRVQRRSLNLWDYALEVGVDNLQCLELLVVAFQTDLCFVCAGLRHLDAYCGLVDASTVGLVLFQQVLSGEPM